MSAQRSALAIGAGGFSGMAWISGILAGFHDAGIKSIDTDLVMGTSGGSIVGVYISAGLPLDEFSTYRSVAHQAGTEFTLTVPPGRGVEGLLNELTYMTAGLTDPVAIRRAVGQAAAVAPGTVSEDEYRKSIALTLPTTRWPRRRLVAVAVDVATGEACLLDRDSGADLVSAVAAANSIPLIAPVIHACGRGYMDAGMRSNENLDLAAGFDRVVVISPRGLLAPQPYGGKSLAEEVAELRAGGTEVDVIEPQDEMLDLVCEHMLDHQGAQLFTEAGRTQGYQLASVVVRLRRGQPA
jgi:NTE family protein